MEGDLERLVNDDAPHIKPYELRLIKDLVSITRWLQVFVVLVALAVILGCVACILEVWI